MIDYLKGRDCEKCFYASATCRTKINDDGVKLWEERESNSKFN
jgi:hypothetical protein